MDGGVSRRHGTRDSLVERVGAGLSVTDGMRDQARWLASLGREDLADDLFRSADLVDELDRKGEKA